jgi:hypothetical protein
MPCPPAALAAKAACHVMPPHLQTVTRQDAAPVNRMHVELYNAQEIAY